MKPQALIIIGWLCFSCQTEIESNDTFLEQLPPDANFIVSINDMTAFLSEVKNSVIAKNTGILHFMDLINEETETLSRIATNQKSVLGFYETGRKDHDFVFATKSTSDFLEASNAKNRSEETLKYQEYELKKYNFDGNELFSCEKNGFQILSSSQMLMENLLRTNSYPVNSDLKRLYDTAVENKSASIFIKPSKKIELNSSGKKEGLAEWVSLDFSLDQKKASFSGVAINSDSTKKYIDIFKGTTPLGNKTPLYAPANTDALISFSFNEHGVFQDNQNRFLDRVKPKDTLFNTIEEIGMLSLNDSKVVLLNSIGAESFTDFLAQYRTSSIVYQGSDINQINDQDLLSSAFTPLLNDFESNCYAVLDNMFVFSENTEALKTVISNYRNTSTFSKTKEYATVKENFANESSILFVSKGESGQVFSEQPFLRDFFTTKEGASLPGHVFAAQLVADNGFMHTRYLISKTATVTNSTGVAPIFNLEFDSDLASNPVFVKNHRNNRQEIVVQDQDNFLYLVSTDGKVLWKRQLEGKIQGTIHQVDIYKNGRLQLAFCTNNEFMIIDRNGKDVPPFKIKFEGGNLNPLAVFDYERNRDYRFVITQGKKVFMYNNKAKIVDGFTFKEAPSEIIRSPRHFRVSNKDYLVFPLADNSLKILHRTGKERIKVGQKINFSDNDIFLYKSKFSVTDKKGILTQIDQKGQIANTNFNLNRDHGMYATSKTLVLMNDNILSIRGKKIELDLGVYTSPKIFYIYDKIYVSVTDIQSQKIHLYDSQARPIPGFPVFGNSLIDMTDMDNDKKLEIVTKDQENSIMVYQMN